MLIKSQEYTNAFNRRSKNILDLAQQFDYRMSYNDTTGKYDVASVVGEIEKYIFSADTEDECDLVMQNMLNGHATREAHAICDIEDIMYPVEADLETLDSVEQKIRDVMLFFGYQNLINELDNKLEEEYNERMTNELEPTPPLPMEMIENNKLVETKTTEMYPAIYHI